jgi:hypothetical protein
LLRYNGQDRQHGILEQAAAIQVLLTERTEANAVGVEKFQMVQGLSDPFPAEPVQTPEQDDIEAALAGVGE